MKKAINNTLKNILKDYPYVIQIVLYYKQSFKLKIKYYIKKIKQLIREILRFKNSNRPKVLQFPITYKCNFDCVMCGMQKMSSKKDLDISDLADLLSNKLFANIESVGINGGEPFIVPNIDQYVRVIINKLPKIKNIFIISNGYLTNRILNKLEIIKKECMNKGIKLTVSISIDGVGQVHDQMRGRDNIFSNVEKTCKEISKNRSKYCDSFGVICTVTKVNIFNLNEVEYWANKNNIPITYNIATIHKRLFNEDKYDIFSVLTDEQARCLAIEWFYYKFKRTLSEQYYAIYRYLLNGKRIAKCCYQYDGVTLMPNGDIAYCATHSKIIGNGLKEESEKIFTMNLKYKKELIENECKTCSHYSEALSLDHYLEYVEDIVGEPFKYKIKNR